MIDVVQAPQAQGRQVGLQAAIDPAQQRHVGHTAAALVLGHQHHRRKQQRHGTRRQHRLVQIQIRKCEVIQQPGGLVHARRRDRDVDDAARAFIGFVKGQVGNVLFQCPTQLVLIHHRAAAEPQAPRQNPPEVVIDIHRIQQNLGLVHRAAGHGGGDDRSGAGT